jgi:uncharacterized membrane protein YccC
MPAPPVLPAARRWLRRYLADLRASQLFLASEFGHAGWLNLGQFRWHNVAPGRAARAAFGVMVPLVLGIATGHVEYGVFAALGAQPAGLVSFQGVTRTRVMLVAIATAGMAVSAFVGAATSASSPWLLVPVIMIWCYVAGVCAVLGPTAIVVSLQWPVTVLIASAIPLSPSEAAVRAGLVLAGGLWQGALVVSSWAFSRGSTERTAMADSYASLSRYAADLAAGHRGPPTAHTLPGTSALRDPNPLMRSAARQHLIDLMEEAERIRTALSVVGMRPETGPAADQAAPSANGPEGHGPDGHGPDGHGPDGDRPGGGDRTTLLTASARALGEIADALRSRPELRASHLDQARRHLGDSSSAAAHPWTWAGQSLHGQLRSAIRIAERLNDAEPGRAGRAGRAGGVQPRPVVRLPAHDLLVTLRANLGISSEAGRHALRLAVIVGLAEVIAQAAHLPHGYWAALTVLIVLRPDYSSTLYRGLQRAGGTVLGAGLGVATVLLGHFGSWALLLGIGVSLFGAYAVLTVNYLFFAIFMTEFVVVLLALLGLPADQTALDRLIGTGVGTGLALLAYILWPTWERTSASEKFARVFRAQCRFADLLLRAYSRPASDEARRARSLKLTARRARIDAEASADRLADEPDRPPMTREFGQALVSAGHRLALATLALEAAVGQHHTALRQAPQPALAGVGPGSGSAPDRSPASGAERAVPDGQDHGGSAAAEPDPVQQQLDRLAGMIRQTAVQLTESLHRLGPPGPLPPLREVQSGIPPDNGDSGALFVATDSLVDALNTTAAILRRHLTPASKKHAT